MHLPSSFVGHSSGSSSDLTNTHLKPSGAALGIVDLDHLAFLPSSALLAANKSHAARIKPSADSAINPQKINVGTFINASPCSVTDYSAAALCGPSEFNGATLCSDSVVPGPGVRIPSGESNLDLLGEKLDAGPLSVRPLSNLYSLNFPQNGLHAEVLAGAEDCPDALRFSRALVRFINKSKTIKTAVEVHLLLHSVYHGAAVYLAALVLKRNNGISAPAQFGLGCFQCIDDLFILCMGCDSGDKSNFHSLSFARLRRIVGYGAKYLRREVAI